MGQQGKQASAHFFLAVPISQKTDQWEGWVVLTRQSGKGHVHNSNSQSTSMFLRAEGLGPEGRKQG